MNKLRSYHRHAVPTDNRRDTEKGEPATVYGDKNKGHVIVNDETKEVVQVSDKEDWIPDDRIKWDDESR